MKFAEGLEREAGRLAELGMLFFSFLQDLVSRAIVADVQTESMAMGQPISLAKKFILMPAATWRYYAGWVVDEILWFVRFGVWKC